jgi:hypothetical protein
MDALSNDAPRTRTSHIAGRWSSNEAGEEGWLALLARLGIGFSPELLELEAVQPGNSGAQLS